MKDFTEINFDYVEHTTELAVGLVIIDDEPDVVLWVPRSVISDGGAEVDNDSENVDVVEVEDWWALENGII